MDTVLTGSGDGAQGTNAEQILDEFERLLKQRQNGVAEEAAIGPEIDAADARAWWFPFLRPVSGRYEARGAASKLIAGVEEDGEAEAISFPLLTQSEELRLDVDGRYPLMTASGTVTGGLTTRVNWIAKLKSAGSNQWTGAIWYKEGTTTTFPYTAVKIRVVRSSFWSSPFAEVTYYGGGVAGVKRTFKYVSPYIRSVEFEFDAVQGVTPATSIQTHAHPTRPATLPNETLTIETVFQRAGFQVTKSGGDSVVPLSGAGANAKWSDMEMHDAMQSYWSRFANKPQSSLWVLFASLHEMGTGLGGIMFDDIGPNHRQGTAMFNDSFIANAPATDPAKPAWVQRMRFWTAVHEMGHAFNLAHSWQKALGTPWIPLANEPEARSFMNYPFNVAGGQTAFFADFEFRFSDGELLFMRHAPEKFVEMGNAAWFDHHGFEQAEQPAEPPCRLELRTNRAEPRFEFMEPPMLELKLTNVSSQPQAVDANALSDAEHLTIIVKKDGRPARTFVPYANYCLKPAQVAVLPNESLYEPLFISAGRGGWELAEPGNYTVQVALKHDGQDIVSNPLRLRIEPPRDFEEERLSQDFFSDDVGRVLTFDGSQYLQKGNDTLREVVDRFGERRVAHHARVALGNPLMRDYKLLDVEGDESSSLASAAAAGGKIRTRSAQEDEARKELHEALVERSDDAAETLGHIEYNYYMTRQAEWLAEQGESGEAADINDCLATTLADRGVPQRLIRDIEAKRDMYGGGSSESSESPRPRRKKRPAKSS